MAFDYFYGNESMQFAFFMKKAASDDIRFARIYDRILEVCQPILFAGKNYRRENAARKKIRTMELLSEEDNTIMYKC